jgi:hypothetical protein
VGERTVIYRVFWGGEIWEKETTWRTQT